MKFCEDESMVITIPKYASNLVYFLLKDNEVVYVGQTAQGIVRPFSHRDKDFDEIKIIYCEKELLNFYEDMFITKYAPHYNKQSNYAMKLSLQRVKNKIKPLLGGASLTVWQIKRAIKELDIKVITDTYTLRPTVSVGDYKKIEKYFVKDEV